MDGLCSHAQFLLVLILQVLILWFSLTAAGWFLLSSFCIKLQLCFWSWTWFWSW